MHRRYQKFFPLSLAIFLFLGLFSYRLEALAVTREECEERKNQTYTDCITAALDAAGVSGDPTQAMVDHCNVAKESDFESCLNDIANQVQLDPTPDKEGCYCIIEPPTEDNISEIRVKKEKRMSDKDTKEKCGGNESLPSGETVVSCKWYPPKPGKKSIELPPGISGLNKLGVSTPQEFIGRLIKAAMGVMGTIALAVLVYAGVLWMTAAGNSDRERKALDIMFWGALGVLVILSSYTIVQFIVENALVP